MAQYGFPCDLFLVRDDYANVRLVAPWGFSLGSHVVLNSLESHTARGLNRAMGPQAWLLCIPCVPPQQQPKQLPLQLRHKSSSKL